MLHPHHGQAEAVARITWLIGERGIYAEIARTLGQTPRYLKAALVAQAAELLSAEHAEKAKTSVLIIDAARLLTGEHTGAAVSPPAPAAHPPDQTRHDRPPDQDQLSDSQHHHDQ